MKGLRYVAALVAQPGGELHVFDLLAFGEGGAPVPAGARGAADDERADAADRRAYRDRLVELETELADAEAAHDLGRVELVREQIEFLDRELASAYGLHGGHGRSAASPVEKARKAVYNRLRSVLVVGSAHRSVVVSTLRDL